MFNVIEIHTTGGERQGFDVFDDTRHIGFVECTDLRKQHLLRTLGLNNFTQAHVLAEYEVTGREFFARLDGPRVKRDGDWLKDGHPVRWESTRAGCIFDGAYGWRNNYQVIELARRLGMLYTNFDDQILDAYKDSKESITIGQGDPVDVAEAVIGQGEMYDQAVEWLNEHIAPAGFWFHSDDGFRLDEIDDEDEYPDAEVDRITTR